MKILVTGGAGYIGSHTCIALLDADHEVVVVDNLCNSSKAAIEAIESIAGKAVRFVEADIRDGEAIADELRQGIDVVIHFAALKAVGESCADPLAYYENNVGGTLRLLREMTKAGIGRIVFSSSATVYGDAREVPVTEDAPVQPVNPYGRTKAVMEETIQDMCRAGALSSAYVLRYFNPVGAHPSGRIGEDPRGLPNNLMPFIAQIAVGRLEKLKVFGADYPTRDGTGVRDYIHVMDLADAHVRAMDGLRVENGCHVVNVGTGRGTSVLELVRAFERASGRGIPFDIVERRVGDVPELWADPTLSRTKLGWEARYGLEQMCEDAWRWQSAHPDGFRS